LCKLRNVSCRRGRRKNYNNRKVKSTYSTRSYSSSVMLLVLGGCTLTSIVVTSLFMKRRRNIAYASDSSTGLQAIVAPSLLSSDFSNLGDEAKRVIKLGATWLHCDIMDGHFVPNLTIGPPVIKALRKSLGNEIFLDCHLMITDPLKYAGEFARAGASQITVHIETLGDNPEKSIMELRKHKMKIGVAVKPSTPIDKIYPILDKIDLVLVMTVEPGFGGQAFMPEMMEKVKKNKEIIPYLKYSSGWWSQ